MLAAFAAMAKAQAAIPKPVTGLAAAAAHIKPTAAIPKSSFVAGSTPFEAGTKAPFPGAEDGAGQPSGVGDGVPSANAGKLPAKAIKAILMTVGP